MTEEELRAHRQKQFNQMMLKKNRANTATVSNEQLRRQMQLAQGMKSNEELNPSLFNQYWPKDNTKTGRTPFMTGLQNFAKDSIFQDKNNAKAINASLANQTAEQGAQKAGFDNYNLFAEDALQQIYDIDNPAVQAAKLAEVRQGLGRDVTGLGPTPTQPRTYPSDNIFNNRMGSDAGAPDQFKAQQMAGLLADQNRMQQGQIGNTERVHEAAAAGGELKDAWLKGAKEFLGGDTAISQEESSPSFFGNFFDKDNYTGMFDNVTGAVKDVMPLAKELLDFSTAGQDPEANQTTMAQIQAGIDADAGRTTQENYELASGVDRAPAQMTAASISESIAETFELAETAVDAEASGTTIDLEFVVGKEKADMLSEWAKGSVISDTAKSWGSLIMDKFGFAGDDQELTEVEIDNIIAVKDELVSEQPDTSKVDGFLKDTGGATHTMPDGTVMPGATHPTSTATSGTTGASTTSSSPVNTSVFNATASSTEGFTMDRFKNPLSAENKAWWLGGGGGVPGNNRAKEFFDTLAYIGTPLKYRPSKTPSQQGMENRMTNNNNMMDYASSMASSSSTANQNTFTKLKAAVPSQTSIASGIAGEFFDQAGMFEGKAETERRIDRRAAEIREKMLAMAAQGIYPTKEKVYAAEAKEAERLAEIKRLQEEEQARNQPEETKSSSWFSELLN